MLFAHGFEGSPTGSKPTYMKEALGWDVTAPKMSELGWSIASQTEVLIRHLDEGEFDLVIGSSMGGLAVANASSMRPQVETSLLLIAPAFGLSENWEDMGETGRSAWKTTGERRYTGFELDIVLPWEFMESAEEMSWPVPSHRTAIMHGKFDEVVPISNSRKAAEKSEDVILHEMDDGHRMKKSLRFIPEVVSNLLHGTEVSSFEIDDEDLEEPGGLSSDVSDAGDDGGSVGDQSNIDQLEAEMKRLEAEMERKKEALKISKEEALSKQQDQEINDHEEEEERLTIEASDAMIKAEEEVEIAKKEVERAIKKAEEEEEEAEDMAADAMDDAGDEMEMDAELEAPAEAPAADAGKMVSVDDFLSALERALEDAMGEEVEIDSDEVADDEPADAMDAMDDEPADDMMEAKHDDDEKLEEAEEVVEEEKVDEALMESITKRVAKRIIMEALKSEK